jgi:pyruvate,water dikinase
MGRLREAAIAPAGTLVELGAASDPLRCGGKAAGLAALIDAGIAVPAGVCLTTDVYRNAIATAGIAERLATVASLAARANPERRERLLAAARAAIDEVTIDRHVVVALHDAITDLADSRNGAVAIRSSSPSEDGVEVSHAGIHTSRIVAADDAAGVIAAIKACWASLWTEVACAYRERHGLTEADPAMAVVVQRFVNAGRSGVAFSSEPVTGNPTVVVIEAIWGASDVLVSGHATPDAYTVAMREDGPETIRHRAGRHHAMTVWRNRQHVTRAIAPSWHHRPVLPDADVERLARLVKTVERTLARPADIEWLHDGRRYWIVQARPITRMGDGATAPPEGTVWTRANLKEVLPEVPSPLAVSYLSTCMNVMFRSYYVGHGYTVPRSAQLVRAFLGRPYLNLTLMQQLTAQAGGDPAIVTRLLGGDAARSDETTPVAEPDRRNHHQLRTAVEMLQTLLGTPRRARRLFDSLYRTSAALRAVAVEQLDDDALIAHLNEFRTTLFDTKRMRRLHEVVSAQSRAFMTLHALLREWVSGDDGALLTRLGTGLGTLPNVRMTYALMQLGALAKTDPRIRSFFEDERDAAALRRWPRELTGTAFPAALDAFLREFGHRGPYESDVMSPRFDEDPTPLLRIMQLYVRADGWTEPVRHAAERRHIREAAMAEVRQALSAHPGRIGRAARWTTFSIVCSALRRLLALRDECRHVTTMLVAHLRRIALEIGQRATYSGIFTRPDDVFFVTWDELSEVLTARDRDWRRIVRARRDQHERHGALAVPDLLVGDAAPRMGERDGEDGHARLTGLGVSAGIVTGRVRVFRSIADLKELSGDIVVFSAIEPTLTPLFPLVGGLIAEMGGLLSHAAILAREYGVPTVVGVPGATRLLQDGDRIEMDGTTGDIRVLERATNGAFSPSDDAGRASTR